MKHAQQLARSAGQEGELDKVRLSCISKPAGAQIQVVRLLQAHPRMAALAGDQAVVRSSSSSVPCLRGRNAGPQLT